MTPLTLRVSMSSARLPEAMRSRDRSSSQMLTPSATSFSVGVLMMLLSCGVYWAAATAAMVSRAASTTASAVMPNFWNRVL